MQSNNIRERRSEVSGPLFFARGGKNRMESESVLNIDAVDEHEKLVHEVRSLKRACGYNVFLVKQVLSNITYRSVRLMRVCLDKNSITVNNRNGPTDDIAGAVMFGRYTSGELGKYSVESSSIDTFIDTIDESTAVIGKCIDNGEIEDALNDISQVGIMSSLMSHKWADMDQVVKGSIFIWIEQLVDREYEPTIDEIDRWQNNDIEMDRIQRLADELVDDEILYRDGDHYFINKPDYYSYDFL